MSGLISKWADEEELVNEAKAQDARGKEKRTESTSHTVSIGRDEPLVSKWANADTVSENNEKTGLNKGNKKSRLKQPHKHTVLTPPTSSEELLQESRAESQKSHRKSEGAGKKTYKRNRQHKPHGWDRDGTDAVGKTPSRMSAAGWSLADRLYGSNSGDKDIARFKDAPEVDRSQHTIEANSSDEEERPEMTDAAKSLARRLGITLLKDHSSPDEKPVNKRSSKRRSGRSSRSHPSAESVQENETKLDPKDAKLQEEIREMFNNLTSKNANWADMEDD